MQVKNALNWKIFVFLLCDINQQYQRVLDTRSNTSYLYDGEGNRVVKSVETGSASPALATRPVDGRVDRDVDFSRPVISPIDRSSDVFLSVDTSSSGVSSSSTRPIARGKNFEIYYIGPHYELLREGTSLSRERFVFWGSRKVAYWTDRETERVFYLHTDPLGTVDTVTDERGDMVTASVFTPFGARRVSVGDPQFIRNGFAGAEHEDESGQMYVHMGVRDYHPRLGRFMQPDPLIGDLENPQSLNRYAYALNNPLRYTDVSGYAPGDAVTVRINEGDGAFTSFTAFEADENTFIIGGDHTPAVRWTMGEICWTCDAVPFQFADVTYMSLPGVTIEVSRDELHSDVISHDYLYWLAKEYGSESPEFAEAFNNSAFHNVAVPLSLNWAKTAVEGSIAGGVGAVLGPTGSALSSPVGESLVVGNEGILANIATRGGLFQVAGQTFGETATLGVRGGLMHLGPTLAEKTLNLTLFAFSQATNEFGRVMLHTYFNTDASIPGSSHPIFGYARNLQPR